MKVFLLFSIIFISNSIAANTNEDMCLVKQDGKACYKRGAEIFDSVDKAKSDQEIENIKNRAAGFFELGCLENHGGCCYEFGKYLQYVTNGQKGREYIGKACALRFKKACQSSRKIN